MADDMLENQMFIEDCRPRTVPRTRLAAWCVVLSLLITPIICLVVVLQTYRQEHLDASSRSPKFDARWFPSTGSESCIRLIDIDGDGLDDVIVALTEVTEISNEKNSNSSSLCQSLNVEEPCSGIVYGIRGYDFTILWSFRVKQSLFELACNLIDMNNDGYLDCIGAGRQATLVAFDPRHGQVLWRNTKIKSRHPLWNFYNPLLLPIDLDNDTLNDFLIAHGGNPTISSDVHERDPGCLLLISSRDGNQIGEPIWMPDGKETYMSTILYGTSTILFGTGGETVAGALYAIAIDDLIRSRKSDRSIPIFESLRKGVMVPPIILDIDHDGIDDILVSCFDGTLELIDGRTMKSLWIQIFDQFEFYASPAPGDFNGDSFIDFMLVLNHGEWDKYDYSRTLIIDGLTGAILWTSDNRYAEFTSPLTLQRMKHGRDQDSFIHRQRGQSIGRANATGSSVLFHGIGLQQGEVSGNESGIRSNSNTCETYSMDASIVQILLTSIHGTRSVGYIFPPIDDNVLCTNYEPMERSAGAIGDLDGDGTMDTVDITTFITQQSSHEMHGFIVHSVLTRFSLNFDGISQPIVASYQINLPNQQTIDQTLIDLLKQNNNDLLFLFESTNSAADDINLRTASNQTWNGYLGRFANSHYRRRMS